MGKYPHSTTFCALKYVPKYDQLRPDTVFWHVFGPATYGQEGNPWKDLANAVQKHWLCLNSQKLWPNLNFARFLHCNRTPPLLSKYLRKYVIKTPNQIALLSTEGDPIHCVFTSQTKYSEPLNLVLSGMTSPSVDTWPIWFGFFYNGLWWEVVLSWRLITMIVITNHTIIIQGASKGEGAPLS